jgi:hypothetical protein
LCDGHGDVAGSQRAHVASSVTVDVDFAMYHVFIRIHRYKSEQTIIQASKQASDALDYQGSVHHHSRMRIDTMCSIADSYP